MQERLSGNPESQWPHQTCPACSEMTNSETETEAKTLLKPTGLVVTQSFQRQNMSYILKGNYAYFHLMEWCNCKSLGRTMATTEEIESNNFRVLNSRIS